jgi:hypothetical protein
VARQATESFIEAQKKLVDVAGKQMNAQAKAAGTAMELLRPFPYLPMAELTREGVKSYVDAQKALMDVVMQRADNKAAAAVAPRRKGKKPAGRAKAAAA